MADRYITLQGQYENGVLGTFRIIRGFASLRDLAEISVPYEMEDRQDAGVRGQQRKLDELHAERIKRYLEDGDRRFLPEVILSVRVSLTEELGRSSEPVGVVADSHDGIRVRRPWRNDNIRIHELRVDRSKLGAIREMRLIRRVDGNHRLALAESLVDDPAVPTKYLAPFCLVLLGPANDEADDYSESLIFHAINSNALPLESEHALKLILGQRADYDMTPERELAFSPDLHFTRVLRDGLLGLPAPVQARLGEKPLTSLRSAARAVLEVRPEVGASLQAQHEFGAALLAALSDMVSLLHGPEPAFCKADFFIELAARVWEAAPSGEGYEARIASAVSHLQRLASWLGKDGLVGLREGQSLSKQILDLFEALQNRIPRRVFLARWYPTAADGEELGKANLRLSQIRRTLTDLGTESGIHLHLVDMGTEEGSTFPIHTKMYEAISSSDIILVDLSGVRPNVCIEAGFALSHHERNRLVFMFQPTAGHSAVPFDLNTFRYEPIADTGEIPGKLKPHLKAIVENASAGT